jgi:pimeloyl-ACP methyl ester carboxylesterase
VRPALSPRDQQIAVGAVTLHARVWSDVGYPILLLHGLASSARTWDLVAPLLAPHFRVIALDERGHGESDKPDAGYDLATFVADVHGVVQALGLDRLALVGQSWGGHVALEYAVAHPDVVSHLILVDGGFSDMQLREGFTWDVAEKQLAPPDIRMPLPAFVERMRGRLGSVYSDEVRDAILGNVWVDDRGVIHPHLTREHHMQLARAIWEHRTSLSFDKVHCPTLVIPAESPGASEDPERQRLRRRAIALAEQRLPRGRILWMRDTLHDIQLHRPTELANAIAQFIRTA